MNDWRVRGVLLIMMVALIPACNKAPNCHFDGVSDSAVSDSAVSDSAVSAGCMVVLDGRLLLTRGLKGKYSQPGGSVQDGESAQCGAERETWEETGIEVRATELAREFANGFKLYWCVPLSESPTVRVHRPLEIMDAGFYSPSQFSLLPWRFSDQTALMAQLLQKNEIPNPLEDIP